MCLEKNHIDFLFVSSECEFQIKNDLIYPAGNSNISKAVLDCIQKGFKKVVLISDGFENVGNIDILYKKLLELDESIKVAVADTTEFLMRKFDINFPDAYRLMSATCDAQICEVVDDNMTVRVRCPKFDNRIHTL